jgi:arsenite methyltransferase
MKTIQVYDKPMCCSTGVCGPEVDPVLPQFAADLDWLKSQGHHVERYNLAQQPQAFIDSKAIHSVLSTEGTESLPVIVVDGEIVSRKIYPTRDTLAGWLDGSSVKQSLPVAKVSSGCCGGPAKSANACCAADEKSQSPGTGSCC